MNQHTEGDGPRVVISNAYADDNRGGAALTHAAIEMARRAVPGCAVTLIAVDSHRDLTAAFRHTLVSHPDVEIVPPAFSPGRGRVGWAAAVLRSLAVLAAPRAVGRSVPALRRVREARLVIGKGGQVFRDFPLSGLPSLWLTSFPLVHAARLGVPSIAFGVSIGPYTRGHPAVRWLAGAVLRRLTRVYVRGEFSARLARELGVSPSRVVDIPDTVFSLEPPGQARITAVVERLGLERVRFLALTISDALGRREYAPKVFPVLRAIVGAALDAGIVEQVVVVVQTDGARSSDLAASRDFVDYVGDVRVRIISEDLSFFDLMALYGAAEATIGGRVHSAVFSVVAGTPAFPLEGRGQKAREIFGRFGHEERALRLFEEPASDMFRRLSTVLESARPTEPMIAQTLRGEFDRVADDLAELAGGSAPAARTSPRPVLASVRSRKTRQ